MIRELLVFPRWLIHALVFVPNIEQLCSVRHPTDVAAAVADARRLAAAAVAYNGYWRSPWQRPPHFVRRLRSQPWYDASEFSWAPKLLSAFADIRREVAGPFGDGARATRAYQVFEITTTPLPLSRLTPP